MKHKTAGLIDSKTDASAGTFTALASVFGNVDSGGDRVMPGAFDQTLRTWRASGREIPIIVSHEWSDPWAFVGSADPHNVKATPRGLEVHGTLDIEDNPTARQVHKLMLRGNLTGWSFGYNVKDERRGLDGANELHEIELFEVGPTLVGMNREAELVGVKSALASTPERYRVRSLTDLEERLANLGIPANTPAPPRKSGDLIIARYEIEY